MRRDAAVGALYLVGLGIWTILRSGDASSAARSVLGMRAAFFGKVAVGTFHPKTIVSFIYYVPQFIDADAPFAPQAAILIGTFVVVVAMTDTLYALTAARAARLLRAPHAVLWLRRVGGGVLIGSGLAAARS